MADDDAAQRGRIVTFEVRIHRVHLEESIMMDGESDRVDPDRWRPLIMSFQKFYGLAADQVYESTLAQIPESLYRGPDIERAQNRTKRNAARAPDYLDAAKPSAPNVLIEFHSPVRVEGVYGIARTATRVGIRLELPETFASLVAARAS